MPTPTPSNGNEQRKRPVGALIVALAAVCVASYFLVAQADARGRLKRILKKAGASETTITAALASLPEDTTQLRRFLDADEAADPDARLEVRWRGADEEDLLYEVELLAPSGRDRLPGRAELLRTARHEARRLVRRGAEGDVADASGILIDAALTTARYARDAHLPERIAALAAIRDDAVLAPARDFDPEGHAFAMEMAARDFAKPLTDSLWPLLQPALAERSRRFQSSDVALLGAVYLEIAQQLPEPRPSLAEAVQRATSAAYASFLAERGSGEAAWTPSDPETADALNNTAFFGWVLGDRSAASILMSMEATRYVESPAADAVVWTPSTRGAYVDTLGCALIRAGLGEEGQAALRRAIVYFQVAGQSAAVYQEILHRYEGQVPPPPKRPLGDSARYVMGRPDPLANEMRRHVDAVAPMPPGLANLEATLRRAALSDAANALSREAVARAFAREIAPAFEAPRSENLSAGAP